MGPITDSDNIVSNPEKNCVTSVASSLFFRLVTIFPNLYNNPCSFVVQNHLFDVFIPYETVVLRFVLIIRLK